MLLNQNFTVPAGNAMSVDFTVDSGTVDFDTLAGCTVIWEAFPQLFGAPLGAMAVITKSNLDIDTGIVVSESPPLVFFVDFVPADTASLLGLYYHETKIIDPSGQPITVAKGLMTVDPTED